MKDGITLTDLAQIITAIGLLLTGCSSGFNCILTWRNGRRGQQIVETVAEIKTQTNGLNAKLLQVTGDSKFAEGVAHGEKYAERSGM